MAKNTRVSAKEANALGLALRRNGFKHHVILARLLIETWQYELGKMNADWFIQEGAITKGNYTSLRKSLIQKGWIFYHEPQNRYAPTKKLMPYLNKFEKERFSTLHTHDLSALKTDLDSRLAAKANQSDVTALQEDVASIKLQINEILLKIRNLSAPPPSRKKQLEIIKQTELLQQLTSNNNSNLWHS